MLTLAERLRHCGNDDTERHDVGWVWGVGFLVRVGVFVILDFWSLIYIFL